jgi:hypothetical protein
MFIGPNFNVLWLICWMFHNIWGLVLLTCFSFDVTQTLSLHRFAMQRHPFSEGFERILSLIAFGSIYGFDIVEPLTKTYKPQLNHTSKKIEV